VAVEQIRVGYDNFSYVIYDPLQRHAGLVDPGYEVDTPLHFIQSKHLTLGYVIVTHSHSDHAAGVRQVKQQYPASKIVASELDGRALPVRPDLFVSDGSRIRIGNITVDFLFTPGHTPGGICLIVENTVLITGDTLFIGDCGRTDLPGGNLAQMFATLQEKILRLPDNLIVYPGHDYGEKPCDTLGNQKRTNKTLLARTLKEFSLIP
jgi:glyoxylase-like metal-dependent hydrolase (beta-lactamase superfamily II)